MGPLAGVYQLFPSTAFRFLEPTRQDSPELLIIEPAKGRVTPGVDSPRRSIEGFKPFPII